MCGFFLFSESKWGSSIAVINMNNSKRKILFQIKTSEIEKKMKKENVGNEVQSSST